MGKTRVYLQCLDCRKRAQGSQSQLFCTDCGGELRSIGYMMHPSTKRRRKPAPRRDEGDE